MEIGKFKLAKADLVRPPRKPIQEQIIPQEKPYTKEVFQVEVEPFIKGFIGGFPKNEMTIKLQSILDKAVEKGALTTEEGVGYMKDRKQQLLDFVEQNPGQTLPSLDREEFSEGSPKPQVTEEIKKKFPDGDFDKYKYGFPAKDPKYEKVRTLARTEQRAFYEKTPERVEKRRELHRKYYQEDPQKVLTRARISAAKPERVAKKKAYEKKQYYELGKREKDLARLRGEAFKKNVGSWQLTQDNVLLSDMVRAAQKGDTSLEIVRGGPNNSIVGVKEGNKIYHPITGTGKPIADVPEKSIPITKHPLHKKRLSFKKQANAFANTKVPGTNITYGKALDVLQSEKAGTPLQKKNPAEFEHTKGVATDYSKGQIALRTANREKDVILNSLKQGFITKEEADKKLKKIGVKAFFKNRYIGAPTINPEKQFDDFKKYVDRQLNLNPELIKQTKIEKAKTIPGVTTADKIKRPERALIRDQIKDFQIRTGGPILGANVGLLKGIGETLPYFGTPLGAAVLTGGFGLDPKDPMQRVGIEAELALAPELVKQTSKLVKNPLLQRALNLGLSPAAAMRAARIASPIGIASLGGEALYKYGKFVKDELNRIEQMSPEEREAYNVEQQEQMGIAAANGGLIRKGFADGPSDPSKRKFMKIMGGLASLPILGKFIKPVAKVAPAALEAAKGMPDWFSGLVSKVIETGTDITQQFAKQKGEQVFVKQLGEAEGVRVTKNLETGKIKVDYDSPTNMGEQSVSFTYRPGTKTEKGENLPAQFEAVEAEPRGIRSGPDDYDIEFDGENIVEDAGELMSDTSSLKQFATGKLDDADLKLRQQKVKKVEAINNDQMEQAEYLETKYGAGDPDAYKQFPDDDL